MIRWAFLDLGGTLLDDMAFHDEIYRVMMDALATRGYSVSWERFFEVRDLMISQRVPVLRSMVHTFTNDKTATASVIKELIERISGRGAELQTVLPEAHSILENIKNDYKLGIVANQQTEIRKLLKESGLERYFEVAVISEEIGISKPDVRIFLLALDIAGCEPPEAVMIGDRIDNDTAPAKRVGMKAIRIKAGIFRLQEPFSDREKPDVEILMLAELPNALKNLSKSD